MSLSKSQADTALNTMHSRLNYLDHGNSDLFFRTHLCNHLDHSHHNQIKSAFDKDTEIVISFWLIRLSERS